MNVLKSINESFDKYYNQINESDSKTSGYEIFKKKFEQELKKNTKSDNKEQIAKKVWDNLTNSYSLEDDEWWNSAEKAFKELTEAYNNDSTIVYVDVSGSLARSEGYMNAIRNYLRGQQGIVKYFSSFVSTDSMEAMTDGGTDINCVIDDINECKPTNVVIFTDDDCEYDDIRNTAHVPGTVKFYWINGRYSKKLDLAIVGEQNLNQNLPIKVNEAFDDYDTEDSSESPYVLYVTIKEDIDIDQQQELLDCLSSLGLSQNNVVLKQRNGIANLTVQLKNYDQYKQVCKCLLGKFNKQNLVATGSPDLAELIENNKKPLNLDMLYGKGPIKNASGETFDPAKYEPMINIDRVPDLKGKQ